MMSKSSFIKKLIIIAGFLTACGPPIFAQPFEIVNAFPSLQFSSPTVLTHSGDGSSLLFLAEQRGHIRVFENDSTATAYSTFLDISEKVLCCGEQGLVGVAFHPDYENNGYFYLAYATETDGPRRSVISRFSVDPQDPLRADDSSEFIILELNQPYPEHNLGTLMFGADGYLYIGSGDGGFGADPENRAQDLDSLHGKILRIDVDVMSSRQHYGIPPDNPFAHNTEGHRREIWAWGFRNPWKITEDEESGLLIAGDVGQGTWEEIDIVESGQNYGWRCFEGDSTYNPTDCGPDSIYTFPIKSYPHDGVNCSVIGGYIYRGYRRPELEGAYIYGDYCSGRIWQLRYEDGEILSDSLLLQAPFWISAFGVDTDGELYICDYSNGTIHRFGGDPLSVDQNQQEIPSMFLLQQNFPNPFNAISNFRFGTPRSSDVTLTIYNLLGEEVANLVSGHQDAGTHTVQWDATGHPSGVYFYL